MALGHSSDAQAQREDCVDRSLNRACPRHVLGFSEIELCGGRDEVQTKTSVRVNSLLEKLPYQRTVLRQRSNHVRHAIAGDDRFTRSVHWVDLRACERALGTDPSFEHYFEGAVGARLLDCVGIVKLPGEVVAVHGLDRARARDRQLGVGIWVLWSRDGTPCSIARVGFHSPSPRTGRARFHAPSSPESGLASDAICWLTALLRRSAS